ncbi:sensor histidine kinase [Pseudonocardia lacus]|uniref:sensor histidine kinase n=1 Tax=Pseudonocardia lacus TaxID=2835865 RepID=UPI001BDD0D3E|nr:sensor histidine kinase [Pseudonocardia lacus]
MSFATGRVAGRWARAGGAVAGVWPVASAVLVAVVLLVGTRGAAASQPTARPLDLLADALLVACSLVLALRARHPSAVLIVSTALVLVFLALGYPFGPLFLAPLVALCSAVLAGHRRVPYTTTALAVLGLAAVHMLRNPGALPLAGTAAWVAALVAVIAACEGWRARRERILQADAAREEAALRKRSDERLRIAQELHDVLGHHVSLINVQAGVALYLMDDDPEQARTALTAIKQSSRDLLREMRATLGVLRGVDAAPPHHPVPGLADLQELVGDACAAGLAVRVEVEGPAVELPPGVDRAAYRIVQEALTNTRRHSGAATATVRLRYTADELTVRVDDDGGGTRPTRGAMHGAVDVDDGVSGDAGGSGVAGMRERAQSLGGTSRIGPRPDGGFRVEVRLPLPGGRRVAGGGPGIGERVG